MALVLAMIGCDNGGTTPPDGGATPDGGVRPDSGPAPDGGPVVRPDGGPPDMCATSQASALATLGCNGGYASGDPAANAPLGACTPGGEGMPAGTCTTAGTLCAAGEGEPEGICQVFCPTASTYISTGGCPTGFRCFTLGSGAESYGLCFRDCNEANPCPTGFECDGEGSCVGGDEPDPDPDPDPKTPVDPDPMDPEPMDPEPMDPEPMDPEA